MMSTDKAAPPGVPAYPMPASGSAPKPVYRRLRGYAFDPSLSAQLDTAVINETVYRVPWENSSGGNGDAGLSPGPVG